MKKWTLFVSGLLVAISILIIAATKQDTPQWEYMVITIGRNSKEVLTDEQVWQARKDKLIQISEDENEKVRKVQKAYNAYIEASTMPEARIALDLDCFGKNGWELVTIMENNIGYFKRLK